MLKARAAVMKDLDVVRMIKFRRYVDAALRHLLAANVRKEIKARCKNLEEVEAESDTSSVRPSLHNQSQRVSHRR